MAGVDLSAYNEEQVRLMAEMCILVSPEDKATGAETKKNCVFQRLATESMAPLWT